MPGVPGVAAMIQLIQVAATEHGLDSAVLDGALQGCSPADRYATALRTLRDYVHQDAVDEVIRTAVAQARQPGAAPCDPRAREPYDSSWHVPAGLNALAQLIAEEPQAYGPILTTNFDPLIEVALQRAGVLYERTTVVADGSFETDATNDLALRIVHLHGFWSSGDTMHSPDQLRARRPRLNNSIRSVLRGGTMVVLAYGGWDDAFTSSLEEASLDAHSPVDIIWGFYEEEPTLIATRYARLLGRMHDASIRGRFRAYGGVSINAFLPKLLAGASVGAGHRPATQGFPAPSIHLTGWDAVDLKQGSTQARQASTEDLCRYFDGATPSWRVVLSGLPRRDVVQSVTDGLASRQMGSRNTLTLMLAATGEGKSTALRQIAADFAAKSDWSVLWRPDADTSLRIDEVDALPAGKWLIVVDDADTCERELERAVARLTDRTDIHFLAGSRDTDWRAARGHQFGWNRYVDLIAPEPLRGLKAHEAQSIVSTWAEQGATGLGSLIGVTADERALRLLEASRRKAGRGEGSLFGSLLLVRYDQRALHDHVLHLIRRLSTIAVTPDSSLLDAFLFVSAADALGIDGVDRRVVANWLGIPLASVGREVERPLADEAAATRAGYSIRTRHRAIASEALIVAEEHDLGPDLVDLYAGLVEQTILAPLNGQRVYPHGAIVHCATRLVRRLPGKLPLERKQSMALAVSTRAMETDRNRLSYLNDHLTVLIEVDAADQACTLARTELRFAREKVDSDEAFSSFLMTWAVAEGKRNNFARNAYLAGASISAARGEGIEKALAGLGLALYELTKTSDDLTYQQGFASAVAILTRVDPQYVNLKRQQNWAKQLGANAPIDARSQVNALLGALDTARAAIVGLHEDDLKLLPNIDLKELVTASPGRRGQRHSGRRR